MLSDPFLWHHARKRAPSRRLEHPCISRSRHRAFTPRAARSVRLDDFPLPPSARVRERLLLDSITLRAINSIKIGLTLIVSIVTRPIMIEPIE
jgi:hypothetical protein